jgi:hypothetical protein
VCACTHAGGRLCALQNARMGRALQRLSAELYDRDTHFVLELVQVGVVGWWGCACVHCVLELGFGHRVCVCASRIA